MHAFFLVDIVEMCSVFGYNPDFGKIRMFFVRETMEKSDLDGFKRWFAEYISGWYGDDEYVNNHLKLKEDHTARVCDEMRYLAGETGLNDNDSLIAESIALFHDVGRFPQFAKYRTYNDVVSVNHCMLSVQELKDNKVLEGLPEDEQRLIVKAVALHGIKQLPTDIDERVLMFARLIRDADKLDIFALLIEQYRIYHNNPENFFLDIELPDEPRYSDTVIELAIKGELIDYKFMRTLNDIKILKIGWVHDINFAAAIKRIKERGYIEELIGYLPDDDRMSELRQVTLKYMDERISKGV